MNIKGQKRSVFLPILLFFSVFYRFAVWTRNVMFDLGVLKITKFPVPVISIGNITAGGTGKTPFTIWLAQQSGLQYSKIVVVSRGYGRRSKGVQIVSNGAGQIEDSLTGGDEPVLIAHRLKDVPVIVAEKRREGIQKAIDLFKPELIILDDAFQHRYVSRDCDIVMIDSRKDLRYEPLLPAGRMREPLENLKRASCLVYTHYDRSSDKLDDQFLNRYYRGPLAYSAHIPDCFVDVRMEKFATIEEMRGTAVTAFAGIAHPGEFRNTLDRIGLEVKSFKALPDHYKYHRRWLSSLVAETTKMGCRFIITTEKDLVKLPGEIFGDLQVLALRLQMRVDKSEKLVQTIKEYIDKRVIHP